MHAMRNDMSNSDSKRKTLWQDQGGKCLYCQDPLQGYLSAYACLDHIFPKSLGGSDENLNLALVCYRCNALKADFTSMWQVIVHSFRMAKLWWKMGMVDKVRHALESGRIKVRQARKKHRECETCTCKVHNDYAREKIPNAIFKVGEAPVQAVQRSSRIEDFQRRRAAAQSFERASSGGASSSQAQ